MMSNIDLLEEIYWGLSANKVRSFLTILGIVIGIGSVIALQALGTGAQGSITSRIESAGSNLLYVMPGAQRGVGISVSSGRGSAQTLTSEDADAILASVAGVKAVESELSKRFQVAAEGQNTNVSVIGTVTSYPEVRNVQIDSGSFFTDDQLRSLQRVAVLGPTTRDDLFGAGTDPIGKSVRINKVDFKVIGVTVSKGGSGFNNPDDAIYVPLTSAQQYLSGNSGNQISNIAVQASSADTMTQVQADINALLLERHHISDSTQADFNVLSQSDIVAAASSITGTFTALLASIAGISLLVGGIGIMNMMLTTVTERTKEIGLRQAIGAEKGDISKQFLVEAVALTFIGGGFGILLGWFASLVLSKFTGINSQVSLYSVLLAFGVSAGIGIIFGYYPARRAANLNPIEALRFE
jgi:putative ABC transport system permease protein